MRLLSLVLSASIVGSQAYAGPLVKPGTCELVIASRASLSEARSYVRSNVSNTKHTKIFKSQNGWYAISIGALTPSEEEPVISRWKASGKIPQDAFCSTGSKYVGQYDWRSGTTSAKKKKSSGPSTGDIVAGAAAVLILGAILGGGKKSGSTTSSSSSSSSYTPKYGCQFVCEGQFGNARSNTITVNTPHTNSASAQEYVQREYESYCRNNFGFYSGSSKNANVSYPRCETWHYKD